MPNFNILRENKAEKTYRVAAVMGKFDLQTEHIKEEFIGEINYPDDWQIGVIVGASGTGKTTIAKELFEKAYITNFEYTNNTILDDMPEHCSIDDITKMFNSVGFSSPPSWLKPYAVLSNGQKMRVDLANALLQKEELIVFDEFTSVVDRNVAKIGSYAVQKAIRKTNKKFIAVACHNDIIDWLLPDWIFDTDSMTFQKFEGQKKNRPKIKFEIYKAGNKKIWEVFAKHHYLSHYHNNASTVYVAYVNEQLAGFISIIHQPHPKVNNIKRIHRLVILPDYQGIGIGVKLTEYIGKIYKNDGYRYTITTSAPSLINYFKKSDNWMCRKFGRNKKHKTGNSSARITTAWEYNGQK
jgi:ABC-type polar amino acid transport system ATPase subunit/GNAT superfamily N-acetyltransferase